jgi:hypothetical protein
MLTVLLVAGCKSVEPVQVEVGELPSLFYLHANATGGDTLTCLLHYVFEVDSVKHFPDRAEYHGRYGGDAYRAHLQLDGSGEAFWADVGGVFRITLLPGDSMEYRSIEPPSDEHYRFWDNIRFFAGKRGDANLGAGTWSCQPLDIRSDTTGIADGTWQFSTSFDEVSARP